MAEPDRMSLIYYGRDADHNRLDLYDASNSYYGLARTLAIIGHYYVEQEFITRAPQSALQLYLVPPEDGSFKQTIVTGVVTGVILVPFTVFATRLIDSWVPAPNAELLQVIELLKEQNDLLRKSQGLPKKPTKKEEKELEAVDQFMTDNTKDMDTLRSITSNSFKEIFRPIGRSADKIGIIGGTSMPPKAAVNADVLARIDADAVDDEETSVLAVVNSFSRSSKTGIAYSNEIDRGFRFEYPHKARLARRDDFSWSQFQGRPLRMTGRFVRFFDGAVKKLLVFDVERVTDQTIVDAYFAARESPQPVS